MVGVSGVTIAWVDLTCLIGLWDTRYGPLLFFKTAGLIAADVCGRWHRRRPVRGVASQRGRRPFIRLAAAEVVIMAATVAFGVALSPTATLDTSHDDSHLHAATMS